MKVIVDRSERLWRIPQPALGPMKFATKRLASRGVSVIDLESFVPEPPAPKSSKFIEGVQEAAPVVRPAEPELILELKSKIASTHRALKQASLDPEKELTLMPGSRMAFAFTSLSILNSGDAAAYPDPGPLHMGTAICLAGANPRRYTLLESNDYIANISSLLSQPLKRTKLLFVNYPHNPTGATVDQYFYRDLFKSMKTSNMLVVADCSHIHPGDPDACGPLQVKKARNKALELHFFSPTFGIRGLGFAAGHRDVIAILKSLLDSIGFAPDHGSVSLAMSCLENAEEIFAARMEVLQSRREILADGLRKLDWRVRSGRLLPFVWARPPVRSTSLAFARRLFVKAGVRVAPGSDFGEGGEGWLRLALCRDTETIREAVGRLSQHSRIWQRRYRPDA